MGFGPVRVVFYIYSAFSIVFSAATLKVKKEERTKKPKGAINFHRIKYKIWLLVIAPPR